MVSLVFSVILFFAELIIYTLLRFSLTKITLLKSWCRYDSDTLDNVVGVAYDTLDNVVGVAYDTLDNVVGVAYDTLDNVVGVAYDTLDNVVGVAYFKRLNIILYYLADNIKLNRNGEAHDYL